MRPPFYITTPIYYVNDLPHIGHAYSTIVADAIARYQRLRGSPTHFLTGLDEHGQKIERKARQEGLEPQAFTDRMASPFQDVWRELHCANDDFIRTTEQRHRERAAELWRLLVRQGDVYLGDYEDWYCVGCEAFKTEKELRPGNLCAIHKRPVERIKEQTYFFRLGAYGERLLALYEARPGFVMPEARFNEVKSFVAGGLRDLSISRTTFSWGVPVPDHSGHVIYVWLDALANYLSALGGPTTPGTAPLYDRFWLGPGRKVHIVGKDILRFHAVYWPAFLLSAGLPLPSSVVAHGWLTVDGEKMSKSLGNFLAPSPLVRAFGADALRYHLLREVSFGQDGDFSHHQLIDRYNAELCNGLGNLLNRILAGIVQKHSQGLVPQLTFEQPDSHTGELIAAAQQLAGRAAGHFEALEPHRALEACYQLISAANRYVDATAPWSLLAADRRGELERVCYAVLETLRWLSVMLWPAMPERCDALRQQLGLTALQTQPGHDHWPERFGELPAGSNTRPAEPLFPRIDARRATIILAELGVRAER